MSFQHLSLRQFLVKVLLYLASRKHLHNEEESFLKNQLIANQLLFKAIMKQI
jgi:hypothetical protein